jgi:NodT family efflux transporter outer membrane factor (OMF) lipoprotein
MPQMLSDEYRTRHAVSRGPTADATTWWQSFADPTLNQLVSQALAKNLTVQQATERIIEARSIVSLNGGQLAPNVDYASGYQFLKRAPNARPFAGDNIGKSFSLFNVGFDSTWEIDLFGRIERSIEAAEADLLAQQFSLQDLQQTLTADVATSYLSIRLLQDQIQVIQQSTQLQRNTRKTVGDRTEAGVSTQLDSEQTSAFLHRSRAAKVVLEQQLSCEFNRLSVLVGESPAQPIRDFVGVGPIPDTPLVPEMGIPADLIRRRPDIRRSEAEIAAATARIGVAEADLYPSLTLLGSISLGATDPSSLFQSDSLAFSLGPSIRWNILHFGRICDNIEIHESRMRQTIAGYRQTVLQAVQEVEDAMVKHDGFRSQLSALEKARQSDIKAVELSLERYKVGKANFQRVLDAQLQLLQDSQATAAARANANIQLIRLYRSIGGGWPGAQSCQPNVASAQPTNIPTPAVQPIQESTDSEDFMIELGDSHQPISSKTNNVNRRKTVATTKPQKRTLNVELFDWDITESTPNVVARSSSAPAKNTNQTSIAKSAKVHNAKIAGYFPEQSKNRKSSRNVKASAIAPIESMVWRSEPRSHLND